MSSAGFNPLAVIAPDLYAKQLGIQQRQALGAALLNTPEGKGQYGGLAGAGKMMLGAFLAKDANKDLAALYSGGGAQPTDSGQLTNSQNGGAPAPTAQETGGILNQRYGAALNPQGYKEITDQVSQATPTQQALGSALSGGPARPNTIPQAMASAIPDLPGMTHQQSMLEYFQDPQDYWKSLAPTPDYRNALQAAGGDPRLAQQILMGQAMKAASENLRPGGGSLNYMTNQITTMPNTNGVQTYFPQGAGGPAQMGMVEGAAPALAQSAAAQGYGKASVTGATGYDSNNLPIGAPQTQIFNIPPPAGISPNAGGPQGQTPNIDRNNPLNMSPGGNVSTYKTPTAGFGAAWDNLGAYARQGINTVSGVLNRWAPVQDQSGRVINPQTPQNIQRIAQSLGVKPDQPINLNDPNVKGQLIDLMRPTETGSRYQQPQNPLRPELPQGVPQYLQSQGKDAAERHDATVAAASESPMRINVLDNIIHLSESGVATGPGQDWQNTILGYASNSPLLSKVMGPQKDSVAKFQELQKFTYQNALRSWQAAGGTGTDNQMEAMSHANPNDHLFPQALQSIAKWGKAAELAVQGKANAQDRFLQQKGQAPGAQISFESAWRNAFDPKVFQYQLMSPAEKQTFARSLGSPKAAQAFLQRQQTLQALGALPQ